MTGLFLSYVVCAVLAFKYWRSQSVHPEPLLKAEWKAFGAKNTTLGALLEKIGTWGWWSVPGWFVKRLVNQDRLKKRLLIAGEVLSIRAFLGLKQIVITSFIIYFWLYWWFGDVSWQASFKNLFLLVVTFCLPDLWLQAHKERRLKALEEEVPYFLDLLGVTLQTGMNIEQALAYTARGKSGLVAQAVEKKLQDLNFGRGLNEVLEDLKKSLPNDEFGQFINSVLRAKKLGVSLANTLEIQSKLIRTRRRQRAEELSRTAAVKISLPLVLFIFPALLIVYIGPGLLQLMQN